MEEAIRAALLSFSPVTAIVGNRVNFGHTQGATVPRIALTTISDNNGHSLDGPDSVATARVQVDCYATTYGGAKVLGRAVRKGLDGYSNSVLQGVFIAGARDTQEGGTNEAQRLYGVSLDFMVSYNQSE